MNGGADFGFRGEGEKGVLLPRARPMEASMRYLLRLCVLFVLLAPSAVLGADQIRLAQSFQTAPPVPPPQLLPQTTIAGTCNITCDSAAMSCLNTCVAVSPNTPANPQCSLTCTTQQLVCKQRC